MAKPNSLGLKALDGLGFLSALDHDDRPTFIIDIADTQMSSGTYPLPIFCNKAFRSKPQFYHLLASQDENDGRKPPGSVSKPGISVFFQSVSKSSSLVSFGEVIWHFYTIEDRWRIVSACSDGPSHEDAVPQSLEEPENDHLMSVPALDLFNPKTLIGASDHVRFMANFNWSPTPIGPLHSWPEEVRPICNFILLDPNPAAIFIGPDLICFYNEAAIPFLGNKYPACVGSKFSDVIEEAWEDMEPIITGVMMSGQAVKYENMMMSIDKHGSVEECFYDFTYIPIVRAGGKLLGIYQSFSEVTKYKLASRRAASILQMSSNFGPAPNLSVLYQRQLDALESNDRDVPFAMIFSVATSDKSIKTGNTGLSDSTDYVLNSTLGIAWDHDVVKAARHHLNSADGHLYSASQLATTAHEPIILRVDDGSLPKDLVFTTQGRAFDEPCTSIAVSTIQAEEKGVSALLLLGISPRRPYDDAYKDFVNMLVERVEASLTSMLLLQAETMRSRLVEEQAALDKAKLSAQIQVWTAEAERSELKFLQFAEHAPIGIFIINFEGQIIFANEIFYSLIGMPKDSTEQMSWINSVIPEDTEVAVELWTRIVREQQPLSSELHLKRTFRPSDDSGEPIPTCILCSAHVQSSSDETGPLVVGCFTDVSQQKWAEEVQRRRTADLVETKKQQDEFIDMTFHEMRNPLGAVLHCSDEIVSTIGSVTGEQNSQYSVPISVETLNGILRAAKIITDCCQHQNRIVDDILTMSKLSSGMLPINFTESQPLVVLHDGLCMFERQLQDLDISLEIKIDSSIESLHLNWVEIDPGRLMQVVINLMTNAIKFTKFQAKREITIEIKAFSETRFITEQANISYLPNHIDAFRKAEDKDLFLHIAVIDTGCGLTPQEQDKLFQRFSQAPRRSHITYGGSGLGLHICRVLVEMQGGRIGFQSEAEVGSTFAFYVAVKPVHANVPLYKGPPAAKPLLQKRDRPRLNASESENLKTVSLSNSLKTVGDHETSATSTSLDILVVEDNLVNQKVLCRQLKSAGHKVMAANDGKEALDFIQRSCFWKGKELNGESLSLILMDLEMPVMNGLECVQRIRKFQQDGTIQQHVPVIAVTANARQEQVDEARKAGMDEILLKPFRLNALTVLMTRVMQKVSEAMLVS